MSLASVPLPSYTRTRNRPVFALKYSSLLNLSTNKFVFLISALTEYKKLLIAGLRELPYKVCDRAMSVV